MKQKRKSENGILALFRYAAVAMSLLSWYTTSDGFKNTVFASNPHAGITATLASLAIQTVLLAGVLKYGPIVVAIWDRCRRRLARVELKVNIREHKKWEVSKLQYDFLQKDHKGRIKISNIGVIGKNVFKGIVNLFIFLTPVYNFTHDNQMTKTPIL